MKLIGKILIAIAVLGGACMWVIYNGHWADVIGAVRTIAGEQAAEGVDEFGTGSKEVGDEVIEYADGVGKQIESGEYAAPDWSKLGEIVDGFKTPSTARHPEYSREEFGDGWLDPDGNDCDARNDILARDLTDISVDKDGCVVLTGTLDDPYTGEVIHFVRGAATSSAVQIDHIVPLKLAWDSGAWAWSEEQREQFANDPANLLASDGPANMSKGARGVSGWMPDNVEFWCDYAAMFVAVHDKYELAMTTADKQTSADTIAACKG